ncbi:MAG: carboxypeptidase-like regulatory domain-containing protein [Tannerellaceae bacterium]|nr:carboxypeptidase-like regulatory domain-containing protein [Tannerellaceae bacterium]
MKKMILKRKAGLFLGFLLLSVSLAFSQQTVTGTVKDTRGEPVIGVNVVVIRGTGRKTTPWLPPNAKISSRQEHTTW